MWPLLIGETLHIDEWPAGEVISAHILEMLKQRNTDLEYYRSQTYERE